MDQYDSILHLSSVILIVVLSASMIVPYLLGRSDLVTTWNLFLGGSIIFIGLSGISSATAGHYLDYGNDVYQKFLIGLFVFYAVLLVSYWWQKWPARMAGKYLLRWPPSTTPTMFAMAIIALLLGVIATLPIPIPFFQSLSFQVLIRCGPFAVAFALVAVRRDWSNPLSWGLLGVAGVAALILSLFFQGGGRRLALSVVLTVPIYWYWASLRYSSLPKVFLCLGTLFVVAFMFLQGYDLVRHRRTQASGLQYSAESLRMAAQESTIFGINLHKFAQNSVEASLLTIHMYAAHGHQYEGVPLFAPLVIVVNPVPRAVWEDKPVALGTSLPIIGKRDLGFGWYRDVNWSISPIGQGYHDGGLWCIALYAWFAASAMKYFDESLLRQPDNPFLLGFFAAASGHIVGWPRGGIDTMTINIIGSVIAMLMFYAIGRIFFGTGIVYPRTDQEELLGLTKTEAIRMTRRWR